MAAIAKNVVVLALAFLVFFGGFSSAASLTTSPAKIFSRYFSNAVSALMKWLWSLKASTKTAILGRPLMKFESGYDVETVFDGSKLGIEPYSVEVLPSGEILVLDSANSKLYKVPSSLSPYTRPKLIAGSAKGYSGHVDGRLKEARMNRPKGLTVDDKGNIYIADSLNMAIRKISDAGMTTIAGSKWGRGGGHVDGPSEDTKLSDDFDIVYIGSSCSLLVIDRGNQAIREIQLSFEDCAYQYETGFPLGIVVLVAAGFFGYMLALLQRRVGGMVSTADRVGKSSMPPNPYQKPPKSSSIRPPLIPSEEDQEKQEGFFTSLGGLLHNAGACAVEILGGIFPVLKRRPLKYQHQDQQQYYQQPMYSNSWPVQDSFVIPDGDEPPIETRTPTPKKTYPFMTKDAEKMQQLRQSQAFYNGWIGELQQQQSQKQQHHHRHYSSPPETYYELSSEGTSEIVFGATQEQDGQREPLVIKPLNHGNSVYDRYTIRRMKSVRYSNAH